MMLVAVSQKCLFTSFRSWCWCIYNGNRKWSRNSPVILL